MPMCKVYATVDEIVEGWAKHEVRLKIVLKRKSCLAGLQGYCTVPSPALRTTLSLIDKMFI